MSSATIKKARVTARIAEAEGVNLPTSSENTQKLLVQTEEKRKLLDKKCGEYEQLCRKYAKIKDHCETLKTKYINGSVQIDEINDQYEKVKQTSEVSFLSQQQKNNEQNELVQKLSEQNEQLERVTADLEKETRLGEELTEKCDVLCKTVDDLRNAADMDIKESENIQNAFENDIKTEKTLEQYLTRLFDDVFANQRRLEDLIIGSSRGRADFRQAEKILKEQKRKHRKLSAQISNESKNDQRIFVDKDLSKLNELEEEWESIKGQIKIKEDEMMKGIVQTREKMRYLEKIDQSIINKREKEQQMQIAADYKKLQSHTPMYAAYTSSIDLTKHLVENLELQTSSPSFLKEKAQSAVSLVSPISTLRSVIFSDDFSEFPKHTEMLENRRRILRLSENEAYRQLINELRLLEGIVSGQRQEFQSFERQIKSLNDSINLQQANVRFYQKKINEFNENVKKDDEAKELYEEKEGKNKETMEHNTKTFIQDLMERRILLEDERNALTNQLKDTNFEHDRLDEQWKIAKIYNKHFDLEGNQKLTTDLQMWKNKVDQTEIEIQKLQRMENFASLANGQLRSQLALLKPYDIEYQEFEKLIEDNKYLNVQIADHELRKSAENLLESGDIKIIS